MVFGETKYRNNVNLNTRIFYLGNCEIEEVTHYSHLGVTLCSYDCSVACTHEMCGKAEHIMATLHSSGAQKGGLYPHVVAYL